MIFDNAKVRALVPDYVATIPFAQGAREVVAWHDEDPARRAVDERVGRADRPARRALRPRRVSAAGRPVSAHP